MNFDIDALDASLTSRTTEQLKRLKEVLLRCQARQAELSLNGQARLFKYLELVEYHLLKRYFAELDRDTPFIHPGRRVGVYVGIGAGI